MSSLAGFANVTATASGDRFYCQVAAGGPGSDRGATAAQIATYVLSTLFPMTGVTTIAVPFLPAVTVVSGANGLDQIATILLSPVVTVVDFVNAATAGQQRWQLVVGTTATGPGIQRPADFNASTNAKIWVQIA